VSEDRVLQVNVTNAVRFAANDIEAVALNLTLTDTVAGRFGGFATVFPCGSSVPDASSLNFVSGKTIATGVLSDTSAEGDVCVYVFGEAHVIVDVTGVIPTGRGYSSFVPHRQVDTRSGLGGAVAEPVTFTSLEIPIDNLNEIDAGEMNAISATLTVTSTIAPSVGGFASVYACDGALPDASTLNFVSNETVANSFISPISSDGKLCVYIYGEADIIVDINGVFTTASTFSALQPTRVADTRSTSAIGTLSANSSDLVVPISVGARSASSSNTIATINVTAVGTVAPDVGGFLTVYPCGTRPDTSTLNFTTGQTIANSVVTPISANGTICVYVYGKADVLIDVNGISQT
jgi:hypothetical protein